MIDFEFLRVFVSVVESGGFNAAAESLFKTQPAITAAIKKLEQQLDFCLFDRKHYRPLLTKEGEKLYQRAKAMVGHWQHINQFAQQLKAEVESDLTIAVDVFFPLARLQTLFKGWMRSFPHTHFHFISESLGGACERLLHGHADVVISENLIGNKAVEFTPLYTEPMVAVASPSFIEEFAAQLGDLDALTDCMQVILRDSSASDFSFGVIEHCRHWTVSDVMSKKEIIVAGLGWGRLPLHLVKKELDEGHLQALKANHFDARVITLGAIRLQKPAHGPVAEQLWQQFQCLSDPVLKL